MSLIEFPWLVSVEGYKQAEWNEGSSLHRSAEAYTAAVLQPGSQWSGEIEPVRTILTGGKEAFNQAFKGGRGSIWETEILLV